MIRLLCVLLLTTTFSRAKGDDDPKTANLSKRKICSPTTAMEDFLQKTGLGDSDVQTYTALFKKHNVDVPELLRMSLPEVQELGVVRYGDAAKITTASSQDKNQCAARNPCQHEGICRDGFDCFSCLCDPDKGFHGPKCNLPCQCKNGARCLSTATGFQCVCLPGWRGDLCEEQWLNEEVFLNLKNLVMEQQKELALTKERLNNATALLADHKGILKKMTESEGWKLTRVDAVFPKLARFQIHQVTPTYVEKIPVTLPQTTRAIIISVFCNFWNKDGHAYLEFDVYQKGYENGGKASAPNVHYRVYANTFYYEIMIPWDSSLGDEVVFKLTSTYFTGGSDNWYRVKLAGYITV